MSTITKYFTCALKPFEVVSAVQLDFTNREKEVVKQLSEKEESTLKQGKYRTWSATEKLEIGEYVIRHGVASTFEIFFIEISRKKQAINKQKAMLNEC